MTNMKISMLLLVILSLRGFATVTEQLGKLLTQVPNGCHMEAPRDMRISRGKWNIFMIIQNDAHQHLTTFGQELQTIAAHVKHNLHSISTCQYDTGRKWKCIPMYTLRMVENQLKLLMEEPESIINYQFPNSRARQGLVYIIGEGAKFLFGTATTNDINEVKALIASARQEDLTCMSYTNLPRSSIMPYVNIAKITNEYSKCGQYLGQFGICLLRYI